MPCLPVVNPALLCYYERVKMHMDLHSDVTVVDAAETAAAAFLRERGMDEDEAYWLLLAIREILVNAITHGNENDPEKMVHLTAEDTRSDVTVSILDEGSGEGIPDIPDPRMAENLLKPFGRGIFLARKSVSEMRMERDPSGGLKVVMIKIKNQGGVDENPTRRTG